jgi:hypothetical protein
MLMTTPDDKSLTGKDPCSEENLRAGATILPWKKQAAASSLEEARVWGSARVEQTQEGSSDCTLLPVPPDKAIVMPIDIVKQAVDRSQPIKAANPKKLSPEELHRLYTGTSVPQHRYLALSLAAAVNSREIALDPAKWLAQITGINLSGVVNAWLNTNRNTDYEQLQSVGLDPGTGRLTAALTVKQSSGYSGKPGTAGSREYVAFWVDWGSGFQYEGTASVVVYDFGCLPASGLKYDISLPVDFRSRVQICGEEEKTVRVRAVLSWNTPSSAADPNAPVVWGNSLESEISISLAKTVQTVSPTPFLAAARDTDSAKTESVGQTIHSTIMWLPQSRRNSHLDAGSVWSPCGME